MRLSVLLFLLLANLVFGQKDIQRFSDTKILHYHAVDFKVAKYENQIIYDSQNVRLNETGSHFLIRSHYKDTGYVVLGTIHGMDTLNLLRYDFRFMNLPDPKITWDLNYDSKELTLHRDSLDTLRKFYVVQKGYLDHPVKFEIKSVTATASGMKGPPVQFLNSNLIPDTSLHRLIGNRDTVLLSITCTIGGKDEITRLIGGSVKAIILEGEAYDRAIDPLYDYHHFSDTIAFSRRDLKKTDTIEVDVKPGHLFIWFPQEKYDYFVDFKNLDDHYGYPYDPPPIRIPAGKDRHLIDGALKNGLYEMKLHLGHSDNYKVIHRVFVKFNVLRNQ